MERSTFRSKDLKLSRSLTVSEDRGKVLSAKPQKSTKMAPVRKISAFAINSFSGVSKNPNPEANCFSVDSESINNADEVQQFDSNELEELKFSKYVLDGTFKTKRFLTPIEKKYQKEKKMQRQ